MLFSRWKSVAMVAVMVAFVMSSSGNHLCAQSGPDALSWVSNASTGVFELYDRNGTLAQQRAFPTSALFFFRVEKAADGSTWVVDLAPGSVSVFGPLGPASTVPVSGAQQLAAHPSGAMWVLSQAAPFSSAGTLRLMQATGVVLASFAAPITGFAQIGLVCDPFGNAWAAGTASTVKIDSAGAVLSTAAAISGPQQVVSDHLGRIWISGSSGIQVLNNGGSVAAFIPLSGIDRLAVDASGEVRALTTSPSGTQRLHHLDSGSFTLSGSIPIVLPGSPHIDRISFDAIGQMWCTSVGSSIWLLDPSGTQSALVSASTSAGFQDVATGIRVASVLLPMVDSDFDGFSNESELRSGSDCFDPLSAPLLVTSSSGAVAGQTLSLSLSAPQQAGFLYFSGISLAPGNPGIRISPLYPHVVPLQMDALFSFWLSPANGVNVQGASGVLDGSGAATMNLALPGGTSGLGFTISFMTVDPVIVAPALVSLPQSFVIL